MPPEEKHMCEQCGINEGDGRTCCDGRECGCGGNPIDVLCKECRVKGNLESHVMKTIKAKMPHYSDKSYVTFVTSDVRFLLEVIENMQAVIAIKNIELAAAEEVEDNPQAPCPQEAYDRVDDLTEKIGELRLDLVNTKAVVKQYENANHTLQSMNECLERLVVAYITNK